MKSQWLQTVSNAEPTPSSAIGSYSGVPANYRVVTEDDSEQVDNWFICYVLNQACLSLMHVWPLFSDSICINDQQIIFSMLSTDDNRKDQPVQATNTCRSMLSRNESSSEVILLGGPSVNFPMCLVVQAVVRDSLVLLIHGTAVTSSSSSTANCCLIWCFLSAPALHLNLTAEQNESLSLVAQQNESLSLVAQQNEWHILVTEQKGVQVVISAVCAYDTTYHLACVVCDSQTRDPLISNALYEISQEERLYKGAVNMISVFSSSMGTLCASVDLLSARYNKEPCRLQLRPRFPDVEVSASEMVAPLPEAHSLGSICSGQMLLEQQAMLKASASHVPSAIAEMSTESIFLDFIGFSVPIDSMVTSLTHSQPLSFCRASGCKNTGSNWTTPVSLRPQFPFCIGSLPSPVPIRPTISSQYELVAVKKHIKCRSNTRLLHYEHNDNGVGLVCVAIIATEKVIGRGILIWDTQFLKLRKNPFKLHSCVLSKFKTLYNTNCLLQERMILLNLTFCNSHHHCQNRKVLKKLLPLAYSKPKCVQAYQLIPQGNTPHNLILCNSYHNLCYNGNVKYFSALTNTKCFYGTQQLVPKKRIPHCFHRLAYDQVPKKLSSTTHSSLHHLQINHQLIPKGEIKPKLNNSPLQYGRSVPRYFNLLTQELRPRANHVCSKGRGSMITCNKYLVGCGRIFQIFSGLQHLWQNFSSTIVCLPSYSTSWFSHYKPHGLHYTFLLEYLQDFQPELTTISEDTAEFVNVERKRISSAFPVHDRITNDYAVEDNHCLPYHPQLANSVLTNDSQTTNKSLFEEQDSLWETDPEQASFMKASEENQPIRQENVERKEDSALNELVVEISRACAKHTVKWREKPSEVLSSEPSIDDLNLEKLVPIRTNHECLVRGLEKPSNSSLESNEGRLSSSEMVGLIAFSSETDNPSESNHGTLVQENDTPVTHPHVSTSFGSSTDCNTQPQNIEVNIELDGMLPAWNSNVEVEPIQEQLVFEDIQNPRDVSHKEPPLEELNYQHCQLDEGCLQLFIASSGTS